MVLFIKQWSNQAVTLLSEDGVTLWTYASVAEAREVWGELYDRVEFRPDRHLGCVREHGVSECEVA